MMNLDFLSWTATGDGPLRMLFADPFLFVSYSLDQTYSFRVFRFDGDGLTLLDEADTSAGGRGIDGDSFYYYHLTSVSISAFSFNGSELTPVGNRVFLNGIALFCKNNVIFVLARNSLMAYTFNGTAFTLLHSISSPEFYVTNYSDIFSFGNYICITFPDSYRPGLRLYSFESNQFSQVATAAENFVSGCTDGAYIYAVKLWGEIQVYAFNGSSLECVHVHPGISGILMGTIRYKNGLLFLSYLTAEGSAMKMFSSAGGVMTEIASFTSEYELWGIEASDRYIFTGTYIDGKIGTFSYDDDVYKNLIPEQLIRVYGGTSKGDPSAFSKEIRSFSRRVKDLTDAAHIVYAVRSIDAALQYGIEQGWPADTNPILDDIGDIVGQPRYNHDNSNYAVLLRAKIQTNASRGEPERIISAIRSICQTEQIQYEEYYPASIVVTVESDNVPEELNQIMQKIVSGGVRINLVASSTTDAFAFSDDGTLGTGDTVHGFAPVDQSSGGKLSALIS